MRTTKIYSITMPPEMGKRAEQLAKEENRTMSELMREALRRYMERSSQQRQLRELMTAVDALRNEAQQTGADRLSMRQIDAEIAAARRDRTRQRQPKAAKHSPR